MEINQKRLFKGLVALPSFPVVYVTVGRNIMVAAAFHFYSFKPPSVMVGIKPEKYSYQLLQKKGEFGICIPPKNHLEKVQICGSVSGKDEDKYLKANLTPQKAKVIDGYIIKECPLSLECRVVHQIEFPGTHRWFIGEIKEIHLDDDYSREDALMFWLGQFRTVGKIIAGVNDDKLMKEI